MATGIREIMDVDKICNIILKEESNGDKAIIESEDNGIGFNSSGIPHSKINSLLKAAVDHAINTCILGASNRIEDIERTNGWAFANQSRNTAGEYSKHYTSPCSASILSFSSGDKYIQLNTNKKWYFTPKKSPSSVFLKALEQNMPFDDPECKLPHATKLLLARGIVAREVRWGNCGIRASIVAKYLWECASECISRIELINMVNKDHAFVIVNREGDLQHPQTWGKNCWIADVWWTPTGKIFHASEFESEMKNLEQYIDDQHNQLNAIHIDSPAPKAQQENMFKCGTEIIPSRDRYPTYDINKTVDNYYAVLGDLSEEFQKNRATYENEHKNKLRQCLDELQKRTTFFKANKMEIAGSENHLIEEQIKP
ncbi:hypothetical protein [uncultured Legionella sp.]|uniref:hypothetical protein n=1 Tax=uncultured Legionella sp. TaxID=210934 RepID=UPI00262BC6F5|nr:hypothetical protein [uncultured Legionella sp.]